MRGRRFVPGRVGLLERRGGYAPVRDWPEDIPIGDVYGPVEDVRLSDSHVPLMRLDYEWQVHADYGPDPDDELWEIIEADGPNWTCRRAAEMSDADRAQARRNAAVRTPRGARRPARRRVLR